MPAPTSHAPSAPSATDEALDRDELAELPPLDGDVRDAPVPETDETDGSEVDDGEASLDDSTGEDDPTDNEEIDLDESDSGWLDEPPDAPTLDLGDPGNLDFGSEATSADDDGEAPGAEAGTGQEDLDFGSTAEHEALDAGDEGPIDPDEELRAEDLPALDADEEGDVDEAGLIDPSFGADELHPLPWAAAPWERVGSPLPIVRASAVACSARGAVAVGRQEGGGVELWRVDLEGASQPLAARGLELPAVRALAGDGATVHAQLASGQGVASTDGGVTFAPAPSAEGARPAPPAPPPEARVPPVFATRAGVEAYAAGKGGVLRRATGGAFALHPWAGRVTALALLDDAGTIVAATYSEVDDTTALVRLDAAGQASVVARVGATRADPESDGQVLALAHDEARGVVWIAGGFGLAAFAVR